ncbi:hypothetical protein Afil01_55560 [Actinorhabdospora filicis]|uniref:Transglutaminase-like domain-containing protein n=1 Tax=Actinorhabdospora filicis TaxID=1785913 RepID=A0A9W6WBL8_9ACTN|nr:transglutaminase-like domain-containing protein [Actinorhabdospora filicis]GLZ80749.1 hypothetical protein Afil01_55560 [Actinorhabdospora filicis]
MNVLTRPEAGFYGTHSAATDPDTAWSRLGELAGEPAELAAMVRGLLLHRLDCAGHGLDLTPERLEQGETRYTGAIIAHLVAANDARLSETRAPGDRFVGTCRDFALLFTAALRHGGVPARLRCGWATYLEEGFHGDHWVTEYWRPGKGWTLADPEFDTVTQGFDTMDVPRDRFLVAGDAWRAYRAGDADPQTFGVRLPTGDLLGPAMIRGNVVRDLAALNKVEVLPWDVWGHAEPDGEQGDEVLAVLDRAADLSAEGGPFESIRELYEETPGFKVSAPIVSYAHDGERTVELRGY